MELQVLLTIMNVPAIICIPNPANFHLTSKCPQNILKTPLMSFSFMPYNADFVNLVHYTCNNLYDDYKQLNVKT